jgi:hypothetical protein
MARKKPEKAGREKRRIARRTSTSSASAGTSSIAVWTAWPVPNCSRCSA